jgi:hypothetical protein
MCGAGAQPLQAGPGLAHALQLLQERGGSQEVGVEGCGHTGREHTRQRVCQRHSHLCQQRVAQEVENVQAGLGGQGGVQDGAAFLLQCGQQLLQQLRQEVLAGCGGTGRQRLSDGRAGACLGLLDVCRIKREWFCRNSALAQQCQALASLRGYRPTSSACK